jgi:hypothetical protein
MDKIELIGLIARIRRNQPRNIDVMRALEELERYVTKPVTVTENVTVTAPVTRSSVTNSRPLGERPMTAAERKRRQRERERQNAGEISSR